MILSIFEAVRVAGICVVRKQANLRECQPSATRTTSGGMLKSMPERNLLLEGGWGGREYKARCNLHLATLVPEVVLDSSPREKGREFDSRPGHENFRCPGRAWFHLLPSERVH